MDNKNFLKLVELFEKESAARIAENAAFSQTIQDLNSTIAKLNETIGALLEENRLLKGPKKNSSNSSIPPSKDENRPARTVSLRKSRGKSSGGQKGHEGSTLTMTLKPKDMLDKAAFEHDVSYYLAETGGVEGALSEVDVAQADRVLADEAYRILGKYHKGEIDPVTGSKISERTYRMATAVYLAFKPIEKKKYGGIYVRTAINSFFQNVLFNFKNNMK